MDIPKETVVAFKNELQKMTEAFEMMGNTLQLVIEMEEEERKPNPETEMMSIDESEFSNMLFYLQNEIEGFLDDVADAIAGVTTKDDDDDDDEKKHSHPTVLNMTDEKASRPPEVEVV